MEQNETFPLLADDNGEINDPASGFSLNTAPAHQGGKTSGGSSETLRVVFCKNLDFTMNFEEVALLSKKYGKVEKIRLKIAENESTLEAYIVYNNNAAAESACIHLNDHKVNDLILQAKLYDVRNLKDDPFDFFPEDVSDALPQIDRPAPAPIWFVATYKENSDNFLKASETLNRALNGIPPNNLKKYGRSILIKAKNKIQAKLLQGFKPSQISNIGSVSSHRTFNSVKGIIYSKDIYELSEEEILYRSPPSVYQVTKLKGNNNVILLNFSTEYLPDHISFGEHVRVRVRRFKPNPKQCRRCLEYGHISDHCLKLQRCHRCSGTHEADFNCNLELFCFLCDGKHSPSSNECLRRRFEREIVETADVEHISIGSAKRQIMGANRNENSSYAQVIKKMKLTTARRREPANRAANGNNSVTTKSASITLSESHQSLHNAELGTSLVPDIKTPLRKTPVELSRSDPSISEIASSSNPDATIPSGVGKKETSKHKNETSHEIGGWRFVPKNKRSLQPSPKKLDVETSNRFEALDPFGSLLTPQPLKKLAVSKSVCDLSTKVASEIPSTTPMEESTPTGVELENSQTAADPLATGSRKDKDMNRHPSTHNLASKPHSSSRTPSSSPHSSGDSNRKSSKYKPTLLTKPSGLAKSSRSLSKQGRTESSTPRRK